MVGMGANADNWCRGSRLDQAGMQQLLTGTLPHRRASVEVEEPKASAVEVANQHSGQPS
jgi:hypothetical protein